jgi:hypothetical protein
MPLIGVLYGKQANSALLALPLIVYHAIQILLVSTRSLGLTGT